MILPLHYRLLNDVSHVSYLVKSLHMMFLVGEQCQMLDGVWYNEYGSQMKLNHNEDGILFGQYTAAAEELGVDSKSNAQSDITGH